MSRYSLKGLGATDFSRTYTQVPASAQYRAAGTEYRPVLAAQQMLIASTPIAQPQPGPAAYPGTLTLAEQAPMPTGSMRLGPVPQATSPFDIANAAAGMTPGSRPVADATGIRRAGQAVDQAHDASLTPEVGGGGLVHREVEVTSTGSSSSTPSARAGASYGAWAVAITTSVLVIGGLAWWVWRR